MSKKITKRKQDSTVDFSWTDDELQLLLEVTVDYKSKCEFEGSSWESKRSKYESICELLLERYPEDVTTYQNKYQINEDRVSAKLKIITAGFRKAVDAGKHSGGGRVVFTFFNLCESLWGGSPAVKSISNSIDTSTDRENPDDQHSENEDDNEALDGDSLNSSGSNFATTSQNNKSNGGALDRNAAAVLSDSEHLSESTSSEATAKRRKNVSDMLKNRKDQKLSLEL